MREAIARVPGLDPKEIEDVILGCAMPEAEQGMNVARNASLRAQLPIELSAMTINRFCSSGLQSIALAAQRIMSGQGDVALAGGTESMSMVPMGGTQDRAQSLVDGKLSGFVPRHGTHRGKSGQEIRHHPRTSRSVFLPQPPESLRGHRRRKFQG
jgi:acetyl-CoA acetyltransferase